MKNTFGSILLVDDDDICLFICKKMLNEAGFTENIASVTNGQEALDYLHSQLPHQENTLPDLIILDINMPVMDGMECVRRVRAMPDQDKATVPIVAITGNAKNYTEEEFKTAGFNDVLVKPLNFDRLVEVVNQLTDK